MTGVDHAASLGLADDELRRLEPLAVTPPSPVAGAWSIGNLRDHLQFAIDVEHYTIPYYMAAWLSIKDQAAEAARLVKTVVNQEMLHLQCAANLLNTFGGQVALQAPMYGTTLPHLDFALDDPDPTTIFTPFSTQIGPFDTWRLNTMCIIEYPEWTEPPDPASSDDDADREKYGSIGALYHAIEQRLPEFVDEIKPGCNQVDLFGGFYPDARLTVTASGEEGLRQADELLQIIVTQGEGEMSSADDEPEGADAGVPERFQNQVDDLQPAFDHYDKFTYLRDQPLPDVWEPLPERTAAARRAQAALLRRYAELLGAMDALFSGHPAEDFATAMYGTGAAISECWQRGVVPVFGLRAELQPANDPRG